MKMRRRELLIASLSGLTTPLLAQDKLVMELNQASRAELESLPGLGVQLVERLLIARAKRPFSDWADLRGRVAGIGAATAKKLSAQGLRVNGQAYPGAHAD
jgi:competence protein ComEA